MRKEFQSELLKFLVQSKEGKKFIPMIDSAIFDLYEHQIVFDLIQDFSKNYLAQPTLTSLLQFFDVESKKQEIPSDIYKKLEGHIRTLYVELDTNTTQIKEHIIEYQQRKLTKLLFKEYAGGINEGDDEFFKRMEREMIRISQLAKQTDEDEANKGEFLLRDYKEGNFTVISGAPTYLKGLNKMTSTKGFYSPQLVVIMGGPKSFKTGTLINLAVNYVRDGLKVYYADCENGKGRIRDRAKQCMLECTFSELVSGDLDKTLTEMVKRFKVMQGDMKFDFYPAHTKTIGDIEAELDYLREEFDWIPDVICYDYLDLMKPIDYTIREKRLKIQAVYFDAINLQNKIGAFGITLSQVNRDAVNKKVIDMTGFAEDFGKAANCHAAFALCGDPDERAAGFIRVVPVAQRDGVAYHGKNVCLLKVDEARQSLKETTFEEAARHLKLTEPKKTRVRKRPSKKELSDA